MTTAMALHNREIRAAMWAQAGYVIEQEGDSFSVAFYNPVDAVAFCLQVWMLQFGYSQSICHTVTAFCRLQDGYGDSRH